MSVFSLFFDVGRKGCPSCLSPASPSFWEPILFVILLYSCIGVCMTLLSFIFLLLNISPPASFYRRLIISHLSESLMVAEEPDFP